MTGQHWRKLGRVFCADRQSAWMATHAAYPVGIPLDDRIVRIFFSPRDQQNRSSITWLDAAVDPHACEVIRVGDRPLLSPGARGAFDDSGVTVSCVLPHDGKLYVYYLGWTL